MSKFATMWIRDGVLVNRMHINPVAFAFAYWQFADPGKREQIEIETLINFGFEKSGVSCAEKMQMFNQERVAALPSLEAAADFYNIIASDAATHCDYFPGALDHMRSVQSQGGASFVTSAVQQEVLNDWTKTDRGKQLTPYLREILGRRTDFTKGPDHFRYASEQVDGGPIYYTADAVSEIKTASENASRFNIVPIGFAYWISPEQITEAVGLVRRAVANAAGKSAGSQEPTPKNGSSHFDISKVHLPSQDEICEQLKSAGAKYLVRGDVNTIYSDLGKVWNTLQT